MQMEPCPEFEDLGFSVDHHAIKNCDEDGNWWVHPETNK